MQTKTGQATLEYILTLVATILFVALLLSQIDTPIKRWWDQLGRKVSAPCPTKECVDQVPQTVP
ncbi:MAG: hypothetical protein AAB309_01380 [Deltaproteobacteria bacterium]